MPWSELRKLWRRVCQNNLDGNVCWRGALSSEQGLAGFGASGLGTTESSFGPDIASLLGDIDSESALEALAAAIDVTLLLDKQGIVRDVYFSDESLLDTGARHWIGKPWSSTVTKDTVPKLEALLREAEHGGPTVWRQVNHPSARGVDVPISYAVRRFGSRGTLVAMGRDLRANSALQQRLVEAQQSVERDYWRLRHAQSLYRVALQLSSDAMLIIDAGTLTVIEANPAAGRLLSLPASEMVGRVFPNGFDAESSKAIAAQLNKARVSTVVDEVQARLIDGGRDFFVACSHVRQENSALFMVRLTPLRVDDNARGVMNRLIDVAPDGFLMTDIDGRVIAANRTFVELAQLASEEEVCGRRLEQWLGRTTIDADVLLTNMRQYGSVRLFGTTMRGAQGNVAEVEVSAVTVSSGRDRAFGFAIRDVGRRLGTSHTQSASGERPQPRTVEQLTELVGRVPLKDLVGETTDIIERLCIEAALELTQDNRAAAAEMLGLSRQSLYVKLRRHGLGDLPTDERLSGESLND
jgi:transcriptional regulator PpsR